MVTGINMKTLEIKKLVKQITGFDYVAVRKGSGSMSGKILVFCSCNNKITFKPFEEQLRKLFNIETYGWDILILKGGE